MECIICNSADLRSLKIKKINQTGYECRKCSFIFLWPQPSTEEIKLIYEKSYYQSWGVFDDGENNETANLKKATSRIYLNKIRLYQSTGKLLDIGSAFGYFMEEAQKHGFDVFGVELSGFSSAVAKKKFRERIFEGKLEETKFPDKNFDVITMFDLVEHIPQPLEFMKEAKRIIRPQGIVAITTPDTESLSYKLLGLSGWFHWKLEHLGYFNRRSIEELARRTGFTLVEKRRAYKTMSFKYLFDQFKMFPHPIFSPLMRFLNKLLPYSLKNKEFKISGGEMFVVLKADQHEI